MKKWKVVVDMDISYGVLMVLDELERNRMEQTLNLKKHNEKKKLVKAGRSHDRATP